MKLLNMKSLGTIFLIGVIAGCVGIFLTVLLHEVQHLVFGYTYLDNYSFREGVDHAAPLRRVYALMACGLIGGLGWVLLHRYGSPIRSVKEVIDTAETDMPVKTTVLHAILQIITVAMGSPLGREVAPREMSVALTTFWLRLTHFQLSEKESKILLACASGAGLAAVYNVPLASTIFILETLVMEWSVPVVGAALLSCSISVLIVRFGLGDFIQYPLPSYNFNEWIILWCLIAAPCLALGVYLFNKTNAALPKVNRKSYKMVIISFIAFTCIGLLSIYYPAILGNGKPGVQLAFMDSVTWSYGFQLFLVKWLAILLATFAGAYGGRITPSMMLGALLALVLTVLWNTIFSNIILPIEVTTVVGAAVFLGLAQKMVVTSVVFLIELGRFSPAYIFPICACMGLAVIILKLLEQYADKRSSFK